MSNIFLDYFESELYYRDGPPIKMFLLLGHEKNVIYLKLVNNPFKHLSDVQLKLADVIILLFGKSQAPTILSNN